MKSTRITVMHCYHLFIQKSGALFTSIMSLTAMMALAFPLYASSLSLQQAQQLAIANDPMLKRYHFQKDAFKREGKAAEYWDNPKLATSIQNLPTDGFRFNQEPMTQVKVGIKQTLPRGDENTYVKQKFEAMSNAVSMASASRKAWLIKQVGEDWLNWYFSTQRLRLLEKERQLLTQLLDFTESRYGQAFGDAQQQDILQVRLALLTLDDKFTSAYQQQQEARAALSQWFGVPLDNGIEPAQSDELTHLLLSYDTTVEALVNTVAQQEPFSLLQTHPEALQIKQASNADTAELNIAREQTKSQWAIEASYGYRQDDEMGMSRADFVSIGVQVDLPFFTKPKQDERIGAAAARLNARKTDFRLKVNELAAQAEVLKYRLSSLSERRALYSAGLIDEVAQLAQSLLAAYTTDNGNFTDVINANIQQVKVEEELLRIEVEQAKTLNSLAYLYLPSAPAFASQKP